MRGRRRPAALLIALLLGAVVAMELQLDRDVRGLLGEESDAASVLDSAEGRMLTVAVIHPDADRRSAIANDLADRLAGDPMVAHVTAGPETPPPELVDWLWQVRFLLAPPTAGDLTVQAMTSSLQEARAALLDPAQGLLAARYLLDPTGSFRRLTSALGKAGAEALPHHGGVTQTRDDSAALILIELAGLPFDAARQAGFDDALRAGIEEAGAEALLIGPRSLSARISQDIAARSLWTGALGGLLVLAWMALLLRPVTGLLGPFLPVAIGGLAAALAVQLVFGSVHVVAIGFGGALLGLAVDYPFHLIGHGGGDRVARREAARKVLIGAATTAAAFGALVFSGITAVAQAGVFVAVGLLLAAAASLWLFRGDPGVRLLTESLTLRPMTARLKMPALVVVAVLSAAMLWLLPHRAADRLIAIPPEVARDIARMAAMTDPPSGRYSVEVTGSTLPALVAKLRDVSQRLDALVATGAMSRHASLARALPDPGAPASLPEAEEISPRIVEALDRAGLDPGFAGDILDAYRVAPGPGGSGAAVPRLPELHGPLADALRQDDQGYAARVRLWDVADPAALQALAGPGVQVVDRQADFAGRLQHLTNRVWLCFAIGAVAALLLLVATVRPWSRAAEIALGTAAAALLAALIAVLAAGSLGIFQILALALVAGIGIDYGLFLVLSGPDMKENLGRHSVLVCASTTLIAFVTMSLSGVSVLQDIGLAVSAGVVLMLAVNLVRQSGPADSPGRN